MIVTLSANEPILCFGGPYSNLEAATAIRQEATRLGIPPNQVICTGDVVAYCADPQATVDLIRDWGCHVIKGNCEENLAQDADDCGCGFVEGGACDLLSRGWYGFARAGISDASRRWMAALPAFLDCRIGTLKARVVHGGVDETSRFIFASTSPDEKQREAAKADADIIIAGHCGIPFIERLPNGLWFNPGVIGMPANDGTTDGWYGIIHPDKNSARFELHRLEYDWQSAANRLSVASFAPPYATALTTGRWPSLESLPPEERTATAMPLSDHGIGWSCSRLRQTEE